MLFYTAERVNGADFQSAGMVNGAILQCRKGELFYIVEGVNSAVLHCRRGN